MISTIQTETTERKRHISSLPSKIQRGTKRNQSTDEQKRVLKNTDGTTKSPLQTREPTDSVRSTPTPAGRRNRQKKRTDAFRRTD